jgi:O-antigen/teichoic acid export membrane protein
MQTEDARRAARNISALVAASILSKGLLFGWQVLLGRWLGVAEYGIFNTVMGLVAIGSTITAFGISMIAIREIARHPAHIRQYAAALLFLQTLFALLTYPALVATASLAGYSPYTIAYTALAAISLFCDLFGNIAHDLFLAQEQMLLTSAVEIGHIVVRVLLAGAALLSGWGLAGIYLATIFSSVLRACVLWGFHVRAGLTPQFPIPRDFLLPLLLNAAPIAAMSFMALVYQHIDKLMTSSFLGEANTGYLGPAYLINFGVIELLSTTVLVAMYPLLSRYFQQGGEIFGVMVEKLARYMMVVAFPIALTVCIFASAIILFIYDPQYSPTISILQIFIWYTLITMIGNVFSKALIIQNRQRLIMLMRAGSLALNIVLNIILLVIYRDPRGPAAASVIAEILMVGWMIAAFRSEGFVLVRLLHSAARLLLIGAIAALVMLLLGALHPLAGMAGGLATYAAGVVIGRIFSAGDYDLLYRLLVALPGGALIRRIWKPEAASVS